GATMVIFPKYNIKTFCYCIQKYNIDYIYAAPPIILDLVNDPDTKKYDLSSVKMVVSSAAPLGYELAHMFYELFKIRVKQAYGLTEALVICYSDSNNIIAGSCGIPLPNMKLKILSNDGHELGPNEHGELCVYGPTIMKSYLNKSEAANASFDNDGFLHTGDIAYADDRGSNCGFPVAPAELESILCTHDKIFDAAVIGCYSEKDQTELPIAYIVLKSEDNENKQSLKYDIIQYVNSKVSPHKKIRDLLFINKIPKSESGKILRRMLREFILAEYVEDQ
ncbi:22515_t:CDS:2, partial [Dentiscutata erythropus]